MHVQADTFCTWLQGDPSVPCLRAALLFTVFSLLQGMLFCQRSFRKCFLQSLRQSNMGTGGQSFFFQPACEGINQGAGHLLPGPHDHLLTLLFNMLAVIQLRPHIAILLLRWHPRNSLSCHLGHKRKRPHIASQTPNSPTLANLHQCLTFEYLLHFYSAAGDLEKGVRRERGGRGVALELSSDSCSFV